VWELEGLCGVGGCVDLFNIYKKYYNYLKELFELYVDM